MSKHRRAQQRDPEPGEREQVEVDDNSAELRALWRAMPAALARDSAGLLNDDRHATGAKEGSAATVNMQVVDAIAHIEVGVHQRGAEIVRLLNLDRLVMRSTALLIEAMPDWHRSLAPRHPAVAKYLRRDLASWLRAARGAVGTRKADRRVGPSGTLCPDHRAEKPTPLLEVGAVAKVAQSLLDGPPAPPAPCHVSCVELVTYRGGRRRAGPTCAVVFPYRRTDHTGRLLDPQGKPLDWIERDDGELIWSSANGAHAFTWEDTARTVRCPHCKQSWTSTPERRMLARRLAELGDTERDAAGLVG